jgi:ribosomal protein L7/L12
MAVTIDFLKKVVLSNTTTEIREEALGYIIETLEGITVIGDEKVSPNAYLEVMSFLFETPCQKLRAIKALREATGLGLKEAKEAVEKCMELHGVRLK